MPAALMALTPREFGLLAEHRAKSEEATTYRLAWLSANLLQPHATAGRTLRADDFLSAPLKYIKPPAPEYPAKDLDKALGAIP